MKPTGIDKDALIDELTEALKHADSHIYQMGRLLNREFPGVRGQIRTVLVKVETLKNIETAKIESAVWRILERMKTGGGPKNGSEDEEKVGGVDRENIPDDRGGGVVHVLQGNEKSRDG